MPCLPNKLCRLRTRAIAALSLAGFLAGHIGFPVVEPCGKDASAPFPCMASACSCRNAEACWRGCCCHTNREKLAWAKKHGVTPPAYVVAAAAQEKSPARGCCAAKTPAKQTTKQTAGADDAWQWTLIPTVAARKCQGLAQLWIILSAAAPVADRVTFVVELRAADFAPLAARTLLSCEFVPPTPPPRV
jgi:hypothetical protein